jgi:hypothetical protein
MLLVTRSFKAALVYENSLKTPDLCVWACVLYAKYESPFTGTDFLGFSKL